MPEKKTLERAREDLREGKSPTTAAGEFVREEIEHVREGKHGARSARQAIAIGLSKARRAGIPLPPPKRGQTSERTRRAAKSAAAAGRRARGAKRPSRTRGAAALAALRHEPRSAASKRALSAQARKAAARRRRAASGARKRTARSRAVGRSSGQRGR